MLVLEHAGGRRARAHRTDRTVDGAGTVGHRPDSVAVPSLNDARIAVALGSAGDVNLVALREHIAGQFLSELVGRTVCETQFAQIALDGDAGFLEVTGNGFVDSGFLDGAETDLHGFVSVVFLGLNLHYGAGTRFDDGDGYDFAVRRKNLAHAEFLSDDCFIHVKFILLLFPSELDGNINARRKVEFHKGIDRLGGGVEYVNQTLVCSEFELLAAVLVLVSGAQNGHYLLLGGKGNRAGNFRAGLLHGLNNLFRRKVDEIVIVRFELDSDFLSSHYTSLLIYTLIRVCPVFFNPPNARRKTRVAGTQRDYDIIPKNLCQAKFARISANFTILYLIFISALYIVIIYGEKYRAPLSQAFTGGATAA